MLTAPDEFRSPLHGILASAEFLRDSHLDSSQIEFISTIQNCSGTLLDTINHVLDYSKINSFEKTANHQGKSRHHAPLVLMFDLISNNESQVLFLMGFTKLPILHCYAKTSSMG
jgi:signal transduction histidine kinase